MDSVGGLFSSSFQLRSSPIPIQKGLTPLQRHSEPEEPSLSPAASEKMVWYVHTYVFPWYKMLRTRILSGLSGNLLKHYPLGYDLGSMKVYLR